MGTKEEALSQDYTRIHKRSRREKHGYIVFGLHTITDDFKVFGSKNAECKPTVYSCCQVMKLVGVCARLKGNWKTFLDFDNVLLRGKQFVDANVFAAMVRF